MEEQTFLSKVLIIVAVLVLRLFIAGSWMDRTKADDRVADDYEAIYVDRDFLGQPKDWLNLPKNANKNTFPTAVNPSALRIVFAVIMVWILFYFTQPL